ncbi:MAG: LPS assembly protein LptD [Candidatus Omnitrophica bacterium]|nr:LPS assembly protein LptD [Candidatus Omnitrophota bacterium]
MKNVFNRNNILISFMILAVVLVFSVESHAQTNGSKVELNGDIVEYSNDGQTVTATGNVLVKSNGTLLYCDKVDFSRKTNIAHARGNVRLISNQGEITGDRITFDFETMTGDFNGARIMAKPYYGYANTVGKVDENTIVMRDGYVTTSDWDNPEYRLASKKIDVYPGDKLVARGVKLYLGSVPVLYLPRLTQSLKDEKPWVIFTPGYDKDWGAFLLSEWRYYVSDNLKGSVHLDYRERKDFASGFDVKYNSKDWGEGIVKTYYMNERDIGERHLYEDALTPTVENERYKVEWRHKWDVDPRTSMIGQYYLLSDNQFLKDYFEREHDDDANPDTFFLATHALPFATLSLRSDVRVNRFESKVERLPEISIDVPNKEIYDTGVYLKSETTYSNLTKKFPSPTEVRLNTMRLDSVNEISYPMKVAIFEFTPFVGGRNTYYSKTVDKDNYNSVRGLFTAGGSVQTKFYKTFDIHIQRWGLDINRLRHIITPSVHHRFTSEPTLGASEIGQFDAIDGLDNGHKITFQLENKLQTKRNGQTVELMRSVISSDFGLKEDPGNAGFRQVELDTDFRPVDWLTLYFDSVYDTTRDHLKTFNFDLYINGQDKWKLGIGKRFNRDVDDLLTTDFQYIINPKWAFRAYERFDLDQGKLKEQEYTLTRDLHSWEMELNFNDTKGEGSEIWMLFRLKAFPEIGIDAGTSFNRKRSGSE